jgi:uncharacterized protein YndB with AHSA1/START domain
MTVISTETDAHNLTLTLVAEFDAEPERVWEVWADARKLERWWGPPTFPATFTRHDFIVAGESRYHMTGPAGETPRGWWRMHVIDKPHHVEFDNGRAGEDGEPAPGIEPMQARASLERTPAGTRMTVISTFTDTEQMEQMVTGGMPEGMTQAVAQIDALLLKLTTA